MRILVTGKIGSGKSTYAKALAESLADLGYVLVDADLITRDMMSDPACQEAAIRIAGSTERSAIAAATFADPQKLREWEQASLPAWTRLLRERIAAPRAVIDFPLALESQIGLPCADLLVGVTASDPARKARACSRLGWDSARFDTVDALQISSRAKMSFCDMFAPNDQSAEDLAGLALSLARSIRALEDIQAESLSLVGPLAWRAIVRAYCEPHRRYHGGTHLKALFDAIDPALRSDPACMLAILYHDFVYDAGPGYLRNEELSCQALSRHARDFFPSLLAIPDGGPGSFGAVALACAMIDATKGHSASDPWITQHPERLSRAQAFLDADLSILGGASDEEFWAYDEAIAQEFADIPRAQYHLARADAMEAFCSPERGPLYQTALRSNWEARARRRISELVDRHRALGSDQANILATTRKE